MCSSNLLEEGRITVSDRKVIQYTLTCKSRGCNRFYPYETCDWPEAQPINDLECECNSEGMVSVGADPGFCHDGRCYLRDTVAATRSRNGACFFKYEKSREKTLMACAPLEISTKFDFKLDSSMSSPYPDELYCSYNNCNNPMNAVWGICPLPGVTRYPRRPRPTGVPTRAPWIDPNGADFRCLNCLTFIFGLVAFVIKYF